MQNDSKFLTPSIRNVSLDWVKDSSFASHQSSYLNFQCFKCATLKAERILRLVCVGLRFQICIADSYQFGILNLENTSKRFWSFHNRHRVQGLCMKRFLELRSLKTLHFVQMLLFSCPQEVISSSVVVIPWDSHKIKTARACRMTQRVSSRLHDCVKRKVN